MFFLKTPDQKILERIADPRSLDSRIALREYLVEQLEKNAVDLMHTGPEHAFRQLQGSQQTIHDILEIIRPLR